MGSLGWEETVFIVALALLLFGPKKLPELGRMLGRAITEFRRASQELKTTFDREMRNLERETEALKENTNTHFADSYNYDYSSYDSTSPYQSLSQNETPALGIPEPLPQQQLEGASASEGAPLPPADSRPGLTVTPAPGIIANGSLLEEHAPTISVPPAEIPVSHSAVQETLES